MKVMFLSEMEGNTGPANANRGFVDHWPAEDTVLTVPRTSRVGKVLKGIRQGATCDVVVSTGAGWTEVFAHAVLSLLGKPIVCFNHGYVPFENVINKLGYSQRKIAAIEWHLRTADWVIANSELQMRFVMSQLPEIASRVSYVHLGIEPFEQNSCAREGSRPVIAVSGGTRPVKGNDVVARAVSSLRDRNIKCELRVYGRQYAANDYLSAAMDNSMGAFLGHVEHDEFVRSLGEASVFVMNSRHEPFGLSAIDALRAGTSLLLSANCGVGEILSLEESDIVQDCEDAHEVAEKIEYLLEHPNASRLYETLNFSMLDWSLAAQHLRDTCKRAASRSHEASS